MARIQKNNSSYIQYTYFRHGVITAIQTEANTATVQLEPEGEGEPSVILESIPIFFHCDDNVQELPNGSLQNAASAFKVGDKVVVVISEDEQIAKVVANLTEKRDCGKYFWLGIDEQVYRFLYKEESQTIELKETVPLEDHPILSLLTLYPESSIRVFQYPFIGTALLVFFVKTGDSVGIFFVHQVGQSGQLIHEDYLFEEEKDNFDYALNENIIYFVKQRDSARGTIVYETFTYSPTTAEWIHESQHLQIPFIGENNLILLGVNPDGTFIVAKEHHQNTKYLETFYVYNKDGILIDSADLGDGGKWYKTFLNWKENPFALEEVIKHGYIKFSTIDKDENTTHSYNYNDTCQQDCFASPCSTVIDEEIHSWNYIKLAENNGTFIRDFLKDYQLDSVLNELQISIYTYDETSHVEGIGNSCAPNSCFCNVGQCSGNVNSLNEGEKITFSSPFFQTQASKFSLQPCFYSLPTFYFFKDYKRTQRQQTKGPTVYLEWEDFCVANHIEHTYTHDVLVELYLTGNQLLNETELQEEFSETIDSTCSEGIMNAQCVDCYYYRNYDPQVCEDPNLLACCQYQSTAPPAKINTHVPTSMGGIWTSNVYKDINNILIINKDQTFDLLLKNRNNLSFLTNEVVQQLGLAAPQALKHIYTFWE